MRHWLIRSAWIVLIAIAGLTSWLVLANRSAPPSAPLAAAASTLPDYQLQRAVITRYADTGARHYVLHSERITHERASGRSHLAPVLLDYYSDAGRYWRLDAARGELSQAGKRIVLAGDVRADQPRAAVPLQLTTSQLTVWLPEQRIHSAAWVTLRQGARETRGRGLQADLQSGVVKLLNEVTSRYVQ